MYVQCDRSEAAVLENRQGPNLNWLFHMQVVALLQELSQAAQVGSACSVGSSGVVEPTLAQCWDNVCLAGWQHGTDVSCGSCYAITLPHSHSLHCCSLNCRASCSSSLQERCGIVLPKDNGSHAVREVSLLFPVSCLDQQLRLHSSRRLWPVPHRAEEIPVHVGYLQRRQVWLGPGQLLPVVPSPGLAGRL